MKYKGYKGQLLTVDLTTGAIGHITLGDDLAEKYLGGRGIAARILYDEIKPGVDPFSPDNRVLFITGPASGTLLPTSARFAVGTKSPLTGTLTVGYAGGHWAPELKYAGYDGILISGIASKPVYLYISDGKVELRDGGHIWGKDAFETEELLKRELGPKFQVASIGIAGERLVPLASVVHEQHVVGRGGPGAVMGAKNLKAVAVRGTGGVEMAAGGMAAIEGAKVFRDIIYTNPVKAFFRDAGTTGMLASVNDIKAMPTRNFRQTYFEGTGKIVFDQMRKYIKRYESCSDCIVVCGSVVEIEQEQARLRTERIEHQTTCAFGTYCGVDDLQALFEANDLCDRYGMDTMSTGTTIAFAMECYERGLLSLQDTDGLELRFGNARVLRPLIQKMARKEPGIGALLAQGSRKAAETIGGNALDYAMQVKGLEIGAYDPRGFTGMALNLATAQRGADHNKAFTIAAEFLGVLGDYDRFDTEPKPALTKRMQDSTAIIDSIIMCMFTVDLGISTELYAKAANLVTGMSITENDVYRIGERINNLERMFNVREGLLAEHDRLPSRFVTEPDSTGHTVDVSQMLPEYYRLRGWDERGVPTREKLAELDIAL
ncbi:MAG: aldehyde ferredoxin oxidoreductase family protein [Chloroflexota bacterium]